MSPEEKVRLWAGRVADEDQIPAEDRERYIEHVTKTLRGKLLTIGFASDDLAATGIVGKLWAAAFLGWRPRDAKARADLIGANA